MPTHFVDEVESPGGGGLALGIIYVGMYSRLRFDVGRCPRNAYMYVSGLLFDVGW